MLKIVGLLTVLGTLAVLVMRYVLGRRRRHVGYIKRLDQKRYLIRRDLIKSASGDEKARGRLLDRIRRK